MNGLMKSILFLIVLTAVIAFSAYCAYHMFILLH